MTSRFLVYWILLLAGLCARPSAWSQPGLDPDLVDYQPGSGVAGSLSSAGSDTLANLMTLWAEAFRRYHPGVNIQVQAAGSSTAPPALIEATANLGPMSRPMTDLELAAFERRFGYPPTAVPVALDALALFVHRDNPLQGLTLRQVDAAFSATRRCGGDAPIRAWGELGLDGPWVVRRIQLFGRNSVSGTYGYFKAAALCGGDFTSRVNEQPGSASVVQAVSVSLNGLGYSGIGYRTAGVRDVPVARRSGDGYVYADAGTVISGRYPLSRELLVYVNKPPGRELPPLEREFLRLVMSRQGQAAVVRDGYVPLNSEQVARALMELEAR